MSKKKIKAFYKNTFASEIIAPFKCCQKDNLKKKKSLE